MTLFIYFFNDFETIKLCLKNSLSYHKMNCLKNIYFLSILAMFWYI